MRDDQSRPSNDDQPFTSNVHHTPLLERSSHQAMCAQRPLRRLAFSSMLPLPIRRGAAASGYKTEQCAIGRGDLEDLERFGLAPDRPLPQLQSGSAALDQILPILAPTGPPPMASANSRVC